MEGHTINVGGLRGRGFERQSIKQQEGVACARGLTQGSTAWESSNPAATAKMQAAAPAACTKLGALCCWPRSTGHGLAAWASALHLPHYLPAAAHAPAGSAAFVALPPPQARHQTLAHAPSSQQHRCALVALRMRAAFAAAAADASLSSVPAGVALRCVWLHPVGRRRFRRRGSGMACRAAQPCALAEDWEVMPDGTKSQCMRCAGEAACCECRFKVSMPHSAGAHQTLHAGTAAGPSISCPQQPTVSPSGCVGGGGLKGGVGSGMGRRQPWHAASAAGVVAGRGRTLSTWVAPATKAPTDQAPAGSQGRQLLLVAPATNVPTNQAGTSRQPGSSVAAGATGPLPQRHGGATVQQQGAPTEASVNGHLLVKQPVQVGTDRAAACLVGARHGF